MVTFAVLAVIAAILFSIVRIIRHHMQHRNDVHPGDIMNDDSSDWDNWN